MDFNQVFPFERNRYYAGKMLTSADFQAEQIYMNNKRKFINSIMFGNGIVCGLSVFNLDDLSIMVESGVAVDGYGREIVVDNSLVKKLSAIEGFENINSNEVSLCLRYKEREVHPVYSVNKHENDEGYEYNRISEEYELFLVDTAVLDSTYELEDEFLSGNVIVDDGMYRAELIMPTTVCAGRTVKLVLKVSKTGNENKKFRLNAVLQTPAFFMEDGSHELVIDSGEIRLFDGETTQKEFYLRAQENTLPDANIVLKADSFKATVGRNVLNAVDNFHIKTAIVDITPDELITREVGKVSLEMHSMVGITDYIRLADFVLVRTESAYIIDSISELKVKKYIATPSQHIKRDKYKSFFEKGLSFNNKVGIESDESVTEGISTKEYSRPNIATGIVEIPLGDNMKRGDVRYSGEIMHGLGTGNVYVEVGYEYIARDNSLAKDAKNTIYGNPELFKESAPLVSNVETAIKVMNEKGSFVVAAKLLKETDFVMLTLRWVAMRADQSEPENIIENFAGKSISAETTTAILGTKENYYFNVKFNNMEPCSVTYELTEPGSGDITSDGVYTAPAKEGVYEIRIFCTDMPIICTYAYAVVKRKAAEESKSKDKK